ncbi:MAG: DUF423 domain-containing protein [Xanthobacteraceae bacterium]|nr:DUF423 domain-containing protein [Xanthobacteraceae bacterium]
MTPTDIARVLIVGAGAMGAAGVALAAAGAHLPDAARLSTAALMLLLHAVAVLAGAALAARGVTQPMLGLIATAGFVLGASLFAGDLTLRFFAERGLFPRAAPTGGILLMLSWLLLAVAAMWQRKG